MSPEEPYGRLASGTVGIDVGGTWLRIRTDGGTERRPAPSLLNHPGRSTAELTDMLLDALLPTAPPGGRVVVSLGAAMNDATSRVYGSAPLWGDVRLRRDLVGELRRRRPDADWYVHNDVTCALADFAASVAAEGHRHVGYLTVSSGIALKVADLPARRIVVDGNGLQGEVGHLDTSVPAGFPQLLDLPCECGGTGHVASLASGPAVPRVAHALGMSAFEPTAFAARLADRDPEAAVLLRVITYPVAQLVRWLWTTQPLLDLVGIGGGVAEGLTGHFERALHEHLEGRTNYSDGAGPRDRGAIRVLRPGAVDPIRGAQRMADRFLDVVTA
ncbi:ROK family protein [Actinobacteria bacterium OK074]|nr:ROK family protein [Actinobacteria bacterium OK074]